jgi:hypothetical protein
LSRRANRAILVPQTADHPCGEKSGLAGEIIVENKSVQALAPIHEAQLLTYLKLSGGRLGFLVNWNVPLIKDGIKRIVNKL